jgi:prolyl-tRNA editing enzyme YbaK/EbsC (Cys-tRNA(Pro) deacylase)
MSEALSPAARRFQELLRDVGSAAEVVQLAASARSAADAAAAIGCSVAQIAKSLVFKAASGGPVLVVASGVGRVDEAKVAAALGEPIRKADADYVRDRTGYAIGGVAPIGHQVKPRVMLDAELAALDPIWAAAGHPHAVFRTSFGELERLTLGTVITVR